MYILYSYLFFMNNAMPQMRVQLNNEFIYKIYFTREIWKIVKSHQNSIYTNQHTNEMTNKQNSDLHYIHHGKRLRTYYLHKLTHDNSSHHRIHHTVR